MTDSALTGMQMLDCLLKTWPFLEEEEARAILSGLLLPYEQWRPTKPP